ncbi:MAG: TlpA family protein disulfide reductase [Limisphaerales bacterium]
MKRTIPFAIAIAAAALLGFLVLRADAQADVRATVAAGQTAPAFVATNLNGQTIHFPGDYKGKIVMLDFWATWCGPCRAEVPNVLAAYQKYHPKGFDIVSISLDKPGDSAEVQLYTQQNNMTWPQIYDGGYWNAAVAAKYGVQAIPCPVVVDGDTGKILAVGADAVEDNLPAVLQKALAAKNP